VIHVRLLGGQVYVHQVSKLNQRSAGYRAVKRAGVDRVPDAGPRACWLLDEPTNDLDIPTLEILEREPA